MTVSHLTRAKIWGIIAGTVQISGTERLQPRASGSGFFAAAPHESHTT